MKGELEMKIIRNENEMKESLNRIEELARNIYIARQHVHTEDLYSDDNIIANTLEVLSLTKNLKESIQ